MPSASFLLLFASRSVMPIHSSEEAEKSADQYSTPPTPFALRSSKRNNRSLNDLDTLPESSVIARTVLARLFPSSARVRILILLTVVSAVSADEKNADSNNKINRIMSRVASLESN